MVNAPGVHGCRCHVVRVLESLPGTLPLLKVPAQMPGAEEGQCDDEVLTATAAVLSPYGGAVSSRGARGAATDVAAVPQGRPRGRRMMTLESRL